MIFGVLPGMILYCCFNSYFKTWNKEINEIKSKLFRNYIYYSDCYDYYILNDTGYILIHNDFIVDLIIQKYKINK